MNNFHKDNGAKSKQMIYQNINETILREETHTEGSRYKREWETILYLIRKQMPEDRPRKVVVEELVEEKTSVTLRKKRLPRMVEEY